jgi:hypothetical protein
MPEENCLSSGAAATSICEVTRCSHNARERVLSHRAEQVGPLRKLLTRSVAHCRPRPTSHLKPR